MNHRMTLPIVAMLAMGLTVPASADMFKPSKQQQVDLGKRAAGELRRIERVLPGTDPRVRTLRRVANRLLSNIDERNEPWRYSFDVIENKQVNAFALPGGPTFFYTGLLDKLKTEDELAGVLAHELTHVRREHWAYAYADQQKRQLGLVALLSIFRVNNTLGNIASIANQVVFDLPFSRSHETEADDNGLDMMIRAGYNPQGMVDVFEMLGKQASGGRAPEFLSTHPNESSRITHLQNRINSMAQTFPAMRPLRFDSGWNDQDRSRDRYWDRDIR
jgi:predicted Zn-dependent protease